MNKYLLIIPFYFMLGCQTSLMKADRESLNEKAKYSQDLNGKIEIGNGYNDFNAYDYQGLIERDIRNGGKRVIDSPTGRNFKFNFGSCETTSYKPFKSLGLSLFVHLISFTFIPIAKDERCVSTLEVTDPASNVKVASFETEMYSSNRGWFFFYLSLFHPYYHHAKVILPARKLILEYQKNYPKD